MRLTEERSRSKFPEGVTIRRGRSSKNTADYSAGWERDGYATFERRDHTPHFVQARL
jgi:hypothetical protein